ncbi:MAG: DUF58 domain-containing protein [Candidatus Hodarchaeales archaeon]|jgi:uncharacterized protein (DUF58 family)
MENKFRMLDLLNLSLLLLLIAIIFRVWEIAGVIIPLLIILFFSLSPETISVKHLEIERWISRSKTEEKGELIYVKLSIRNEGKRIAILEIVDEIPEECTVNEGSNHWFLELNQGEEITFSYAIEAHRRGRYSLGPVIVRGSDFFYFSSKVMKYSVYSSFDVVPTLMKLKTLPIHRYRLLPLTGYIPSLIYKGRDFDFQGVRDYKEGDEVRAINWRVTAKFNRLATNEYALDQSARLFIIFDHTESTTRVLEEGVIAALSTSEYLISQRNKLGFIGIGEFIHEIPASPGKRQLLRINEYLIDVEGSNPPYDETLHLRLFQRLLPSLPPFSQIFFISPLYNRIILDFLYELASRNHDITLILPRLENNYERDPHSSNASRIANALLSLDRGCISKRIDQLDVVQIRWYPNGPKYETKRVRRTK